MDTNGKKNIATIETRIGLGNPKIKYKKKTEYKRFMASSINTYKSVGATGTDFGSKLASVSVDHHSAEIFSIAVIVNFVSLPWISSVKSSSIFFPTMARPKPEW